MKEPVSFYTHAAGVLLSIIGTSYLLVNSRSDHALFFTLLVYGVSVTLLFLASSLYHAIKTGEDDNSIYRKLDHLAIFFMIAGTYTPPTYACLTGGWRTGILTAQWTLVLFGVFFKLFFIKAPRVLSTGIYVLMGWIAIFSIHKFYTAMPAAMFFLFIGGGIAFTAGAVIYAIKKPDPLPGVFGFHEIFHIFILIGAALHFAGMTMLLPA